jgi:hypothetical protein
MLEMAAGGGRGGEVENERSSGFLMIPIDAPNPSAVTGLPVRLLAF